MQTITVAATTLFHVAAAELLDATQWVRIAQLNHLTDPVLAGLTTLFIPPFDAAAGGGIGLQ